MSGGAERWQQPPRLPYTCGGLVPPPGHVALVPGVAGGA